MFGLWKKKPRKCCELLRGTAVIASRWSYLVVLLASLWLAASAEAGIVYHSVSRSVFADDEYEYEGGYYDPVSDQSEALSGTIRAKFYRFDPGNDPMVVDASQRSFGNSSGFGFVSAFTAKTASSLLAYRSSGEVSFSVTRPQSVRILSLLSVYPFGSTDDDLLHLTLSREDKVLLDQQTTRGDLQETLDNSRFEFATTLLPDNVYTLAFDVGTLRYNGLEGSSYRLTIANAVPLPPAVWSGLGTLLAIAIGTALARFQITGMTKR